MAELTHVDGDGKMRMVDVGAKAVTRRVAVAGGRLETTAEGQASVLARRGDAPAAVVLVASTRAAAGDQIGGGDHV